MCRVLLIVALLCVAPTNGLADAQRAIPGIPAVPIEPITGILEMFKTHDVVALSEGNHGNEQGHAFRLALIRDPRFSAAVNDIVVEFGNAHYQAVIDRFVQGEPVAYEELRKVWQDTTQRGTVWDRPIYEEFYRAVRDVNATLPVERRLRVLLGDPPMDWDAPQRSGPPRTDDFPASVIQREVMAKKRRALVIYGGMHLIRKRTPFLPAEGSSIGAGGGDVDSVSFKTVRLWLNSIGWVPACSWSPRRPTSTSRQSRQTLSNGEGHRSRSFVELHSASHRPSPISPGRCR